MAVFTEVGFDEAGALMARLGLGQLQALKGIELPIQIYRVIQPSGARRRFDVATAAGFGAATQAQLRSAMGEPTHATGTASVASLTSGPLAQARAEYRYRDFAATTSVTNLGAPGYLVTREAELVD